MPEAMTKLLYRPAHALDMRASRILEEHEHASTRWPNITRYVALYEDTAGYLSVFVAFRPQGFRGSIDRVRCYQARVAPIAQVAKPKAAVGDFIALAEDVETRYAKKLTQFFGAPGATPPERFDAM